MGTCETILIIYIYILYEFYDSTIFKASEWIYYILKICWHLLYHVLYINYIIYSIYFCTLYQYFCCCVLYYNFLS